MKNIKNILIFQGNEGKDDVRTVRKKIKGKINHRRHLDPSHCVQLN